MKFQLKINKLSQGVSQNDTKIHRGKYTSKHSWNNMKKKSYKSRLALPDTETYYKMKLEQCGTDLRICK